MRKNRKCKKYKFERFIVKILACAITQHKLPRWGLGTFLAAFARWLSLSIGLIKSHIKGILDLNVSTLSLMLKGSQGDLILQSLKKSVVLSFTSCKNLLRFSSTLSQDISVLRFLKKRVPINLCENYDIIVQYTHIWQSALLVISPQTQ